MKTLLKSHTALAALIAAVAIAGVPSMASAKITAEPTECETPGGSTPTGQQPECKGQGEKLDQKTENQNPAGKAPAGQNK